VIARRHLHLLIALLLPLMVMRGMLPVGYMPVAEGGEFRMALCSDGLQLPGDKGQDNHPLPGSGGDCLFGHAANAAPTALVMVTAILPPELVHFVSAESAPLPPATGPPRLAAARAPPDMQILSAFAG
jgi:hypothetical protein